MGFEVGAHTHQHLSCRCATTTWPLKKLARSEKSFSTSLAGVCVSFAYPNGRPGVDYTAQHVAIVKRAGYEHAAPTHWGQQCWVFHFYEIPRFTPLGPQFSARMTRQVDHAQRSGENPCVG